MHRKPRTQESSHEKRVIFKPATCPSLWPSRWPLEELRLRPPHFLSSKTHFNPVNNKNAHNELIATEPPRSALWHQTTPHPTQSIRAKTSHCKARAFAMDTYSWRSRDSRDQLVGLNYQAESSRKCTQLSPATVKHVILTSRDRPAP